MSSFRALRCKVTGEALAYLQPIILLQILISFSQSLNGSVAQSQTLARTLLLDGQQRLRNLLAAAPHLHLPLDQVLEICRSRDAGDAKHTPEENAVQALFEMCLGLMLQWLNEDRRHSHVPTPLSRWQHVLSSDILSLSPLSFLLSWPPRSRVCPSIPLA